MKTTSLILLIALLVAATLPAGEPAPEKVVLQPSTWRPYKEVPDVLYFESFERLTAAVEKGKIVSDEPSPLGGHTWKLDTANNESVMIFHVFQTPLKLPHGLNPNSIFIQFSIYADEPGTITVRAVHQKGDYAKEFPIPKAKTWGVISLKLSDLQNKDKDKGPPLAEHVIKDLEIHVKPAPKKKEIPKAWVDDILITLNSNPSDVRPRVLFAEKKRIDMERQLERDGFTYTMAVNDFLKTSMKPFKAHIKTKRVLVVGPNSAQTPIWRDQLKTAAPKLKETTYNFDVGDDPLKPDAPIGGLEDMRTLLLYNLQKDPEFVVLSIGLEEALGPGRPSETLRVAALRALESGTVPIICLPAQSKPEEKDKLALFVKSVESMCATLGVPLVDTNFVTKNAKGEFDAAKAGPQVIEKTMTLTMTAIKHIRDSMSKE
ncbi:MAG: hypothetical protein WCT04_00155 [Planctomycetota bacterium]